MRTIPTPPVRPLAFAMAAVLAAGVLAACNQPSVPVSGRLVVAEGQAEVGRPGEEREEVVGTRNLRVGEGVRVRDGSAVIELPGKRSIELRSGSDLELRATAEPGASRPTLLGGDILVTSREQPLTVTAGAEEVVVIGVARISRALALVTAAYEGSSRVSSAARSLVVPALRQVAVPAAGLFPIRPAPLQFSADDTWDRRFLTDAMGLSTELQSLSRGFSAQVPKGEGRTVGFFRELLPRLASEPAFKQAWLDPARAPGETLVGAAIALEGSRGSFADRWSAVFSFHDDGAPWGLVAVDQGVSRVPLLETVDAALRRAPTNVALAKPGSPPAALPAPATARPPVAAPTAPVPTTVAPPRPAPPPTVPPPATPATPTTIAPAGPLNLGAPLVDNTVNSLVDTLTGLLKSLGQP